jgi:MFS family permease
LNAPTDRRNSLSLDGLNFFLADVRDGLGPYLAIYLLAVHHWDPASIGLVMTLAGIAALLTQTPAGALIDRTRRKRGVIIVAALLVTVSCLLLPFITSFTLVAMTQALSAVAASVFAPAISAISLGITGPRAFTRRTGRNETFNHAGNAVAALLAGGFAYLFGPVAVFYLMAVMALASVIAISFISPQAIDHDVARGFDPQGPAHGEQPSGLNALLHNRPLLVFGICCGLFPPGECGDAAAGEPETVPGESADGHTADIRLHRRRAIGHGAGGAAGGMEGRCLGAQTVAARRLPDPALARGAVYPVG